MTRPRCFILILFFLITGISLIPAIAAAQGSSLPLTLVVRDGAGNPLSGVSIDLLLTGPPHEPYDSCTTDPSGQCALMIPPGAYIVSFAGGWRGREFIPAGEQNSGAVSDGGLGGFGLNFQASDTIQFVTFVIGQRSDGKLIPLWDMSRDPAALPHPFALPENPLDPPETALQGIDLGALSNDIPQSSDLAALAATATAAAMNGAVAPTPQIIVSDDLPTLASAPSPTASFPVEETAPGELPLSSILLGVMVVIVIIAVLAVALIRMRRRQSP